MKWPEDYNGEKIPATVPDKAFVDWFFHVCEVDLIFDLY